MYLARNYDLLNLAKTLEEIKKDLEVKRNPLFLMPKPALISDPLTPSRGHTPKLWLPSVSGTTCCLRNSMGPKAHSTHFQKPSLFLCIRPALWEVLRQEPWGWTSKHNLSSVPSTTCCQKKNEFWTADQIRVMVISLTSSYNGDSLAVGY